MRAHVCGLRVSTPIWWRYDLWCDRWCVGSMSAVDGFIVGMAAFSVVLGVLRGLVREVIALIGWVAAVVLALRYGAQVGAVLPISVQWNALRTGLGALLIVLVVVLIAGGMGWMMKKLMAAADLSLIDRTLGAGFGLARAALVLLAVVLFTHDTVLAQQTWWKESVVLPQAQAAARDVTPFVTSWFPDSSRVLAPSPVPAARVAPSSSSPSR